MPNFPNCMITSIGDKCKQGFAHVNVAVYTAQNSEISQASDHVEPE